MYIIYIYIYIYIYTSSNKTKNTLPDQEDAQPPNPL